MNPAKIRAIERMKLPTCLKDVQKFTGCLASLSRFVSRLGEKALPLYQLMKKSTGFTWTPQADSTFNDLKRMLSTAQVLASVVSRKSDTGSKGYPLFRFGTGREGGCRSLHPEGVRRWLACRNKETNTHRSTQVQATRRLTALLLHV